jgi:hypothetical protein
MRLSSPRAAICSTHFPRTRNFTQMTRVGPLNVMPIASSVTLPMCGCVGIQSAGLFGRRSRSDNAS